jgi:tol-pal system protein YbgF
MKKVLLLMVFASSVVYAESRVLAPVSDNSSYPAGSRSGRGKPSANAMFEVFGRLEQMQQEIQQLRGQVEQQSHLIAKLKRRQSNIYSDLDMRLQELTGGSDLEGSELSLNNKNPRVGARNSMGAVKPASGMVTQPKLQQNIVRDGRSSAAEKKKNVPAKSQKQQYLAAYETLRNGQNVHSISAFESLINEFPRGEYAAKSQYWLGEAYKANRDLRSAKKAFIKVVTDYSGSTKVPDALLKLGYIELEQKNTVKAKSYLSKISKNYSGTTAAYLAKKKLMQMGVVNP